MNYAAGRGDRLHVISDISNKPLYACRKDEVENLFDEKFWLYFEGWQYFHSGFGLPHGGNWGDYDPDFLENIMAMEMHYKNNFSLNSVVVQYLEAIIKRMDSYAKAFSKRK